jgi:methionyl aminopeptidase
MSISIKNAREIELMRHCGKIVARALELAESLIEPGIKTDEIDKVIADFIYSQNARPAFKGFNGYPANICISVDDQVVHGIPGKRKLVAGEIVSVDIGVESEGYFGDAAKTFSVGEVSEDKKRLMRVTREALLRGIEMATVGNRLSDISNAIQVHVEEAGYSVVRDLVGHGIGKAMHEPPQIPNYGPRNQGPRLRAGMVFAIEPMVNMGGFQVITGSDNWTVSTADGKPSAHFEHEIVITKGKPEILTL